jgi:hypothetical protein
MDHCGSTVGITDPHYLICDIHHIAMITGDSGCPPVYTGDLCWSGHKTQVICSADPHPAFLPNDVWCGMPRQVSPQRMYTNSELGSF